MKRILFLSTLLLSIISVYASDYEVTKELWVGEPYICSVSNYINQQFGVSDTDFDWNYESNVFHIIHSDDTYTQIYVTNYQSGEHYITCNWKRVNYNMHYTVPMQAKWIISIKDNPIVLDTKELHMTIDGSDYVQEIKHHFMYQNDYTSNAEVTYTLTYNNGVASVNKGGFVMALQPGETEVQVRSNISKDIQRVKIIVEDINVETATISSSISVLADQSKDLSFTLTPSNATVKTQEWTSADPAVASIDRTTGRLTGVWPGKTKVWCVVNGTVKSNEAEVTVAEPSFKFSGFSLQSGATGVETLPTITAEFSHQLSKGDHYDDIALTDENGQKVDGTVSISGTTLIYRPLKHLQPLTRHTLTIPAGAVKNKWGTGNSAVQTLSFTTTDWQRMTLTVQPEGKYIAPGQEIVLTCSEQTADIYYSTDGSEPSRHYSEPLTFSGDMTLRAVARLDGFYDATLQHEYIKTVEIVEKFPGEEPLYIYKDVNPSITYSDGITKGSRFGSITLKKEDGEAVAFEPFIQDKTLILVPQEPLELGCVYTVTMPEGALVTEKGEDSQALDWRFNTGFFATTVSTGGPELMAALMTDRSLWTWGRWLTEANAEDGSYSYTLQTEPAVFVSGDVVAVSSGYTHHAVIKHDGSLWMWGRQLCGEFGNGSTTASALPVKVMDGVKQVSCGLQNTAIVKNDGTLWMSGRNDMGQIDDTRTVHASFIKVADGVSRVQLNWGSINMEKNDGSTETRTWDATADEKRQPADAHIDDEAAVAYGWHSAIALRQDGSVWTWGQGGSLQEMIEGRSPQPVEGVNLVSEQLLLKMGESRVITHRPQPLLADYTELTWEIDNTNVATVNNRGVVTGRTDGMATVTATMSDDQGRRYEAKCKVTVGNPSGINNVLAEGWQLQVKAHDHRLIVSGVPEEQMVSVYNHAGACVWQGRMPVSNLVVPVSHSGVYLVRAARQVKKIIVR